MQARLETRLKIPAPPPARARRSEQLQQYPILRGTSTRRSVPMGSEDAERTKHKNACAERPHDGRTENDRELSEGQSGALEL
jgi:hypothetical protein